MDGGRSLCYRQVTGIAQTPEQPPARPQWQDCLFPEVGAGTAERVAGGYLPHMVRGNTAE